MNRPSVLAFVLALLLFAGCSSSNPDSSRCTLDGNCSPIDQGQTFNSTGIVCTATPTTSSVAVNDLFDVVVQAQGGTAPYTSYQSTFNSSTTISGRYTSEGQKFGSIEVFDSLGRSGICTFQITVFDGPGCSISVHNGNHTPAIGEGVPFQFSAAGIPGGTPITYQFVPDALSAPTTGYVLNKNSYSAGFTYAYQEAGTKKPVLHVSTASAFYSCEIPSILVRQPEISISGATTMQIDGSGNNDPIELTINDNGEFKGSVNYSYELVFGDSGTQLTTDGNKATITSSSTGYQKLELKVIATTDSGDIAAASTDLYFVPSTLCHLELSGVGNDNRAIIGDEISYLVNSAPGNGEEVIIQEVTLPSDAELLSDRDTNGHYANPIRVRYRTLGNKSVTVSAVTKDSMAQCLASDDSLLNVDVSMRQAPACIAGTNLLSVNVGSPLNIAAQVPGHAGIGPYHIKNITSDSGSGLSLDADTAASTFNGGQIGYRTVRFGSGAISPGITYPIDVEVEDLGDPNGRKFSCRTHVKSVLPWVAAQCTAHFERGGKKITKARARDGLNLVVNANFTEFGEVTTDGNEFLSSGTFGYSYLPFIKHLDYIRSGQHHRNADLRVTVTKDYWLSKSCVAPLELGPSMSCEIDFPTLPESSNGVSNNTIVIESQTEFPGNKSIDPLGTYLVNFKTHISNGVDEVTNHFNDQSGEIRKTVVSNSDSDGSINATVDLIGEYTRHGRYAKVKNHAEDPYDHQGTYCEANKFMYAHLKRTAKIYDVDNDWNAIPVPQGTRCHIRATNISKHGDPDNTKATIWLFGYEPGYHGGTKLRNRDCHNLYSVHSGHHNTSCEIKFYPKTGADHCEVAAKALGWHRSYNNPGDWKIEVWATDSSGQILGQVYRLPDLLQRR